MLFKERAIKYDFFLTLNLIWIIAVSLLDHYLTIKFQDVIRDVEQNPIGNYLMDHGGIELFMTTKMGCLWIVCCILLSIYQDSRAKAYICALALSLAQFILVVYFIWGHHLQ